MGGGEKSGSPYEGNMWTLTNGNTTVEGHNSREADTRVWMRVIISAHLFKEKYIAMILSDVLCVGQLKQYLLQPCQPFEIIWDQLWWDFMFWNNENLTHHHRHIIDSFSLWAECWMEPIAAFPGRASVATSEILSQLTIDQSLEKGGSHIALPRNPTICVSCRNWFDDQQYSGRETSQNRSETNCRTKPQITPALCIMLGKRKRFLMKKWWGGIGSHLKCVHALLPPSFCTTCVKPSICRCLAPRLCQCIQLQTEMRKSRASQSDTGRLLWMESKEICSMICPLFAFSLSPYIIPGHAFQWNLSLLRWKWFKCQQYWKMSSNIASNGRTWHWLN